MEGSVVYKSLRDWRRRPTEVSDGFDYPEGIPVSYRTHGLRHVDCASGDYNPYPALIKVYAKVGLHRYNLLEGTNWKFHSLMSYNRTVNCGASSYYITFEACVPSSGLHQVFHVNIRENDMGVLDMDCPIARPRVATRFQLSFLRPHCQPQSSLSRLYNRRFPHWPSSEITFRDTKRFYLMNESELQDNDWTYMYLELAQCIYHRCSTEGELSSLQLQIVQVAIETLDDAEPPRPDSKTAVVYIAYKDLARAKMGKHCDCKAIVIRNFDESTGILSFWGKHWTKKPSKKRTAKILRRRLGCVRNWQWHCAFKNKIRRYRRRCS